MAFVAYLVMVNAVVATKAAPDPNADGGAPQIAFKAEPGKLLVSVSGKPLATYVYQDPKIPRPYFAHVHAPGAIQVTRNHPPQEGDTRDHARMHPGIWLAFGDLSGHDYWRLKARVAGGEFVVKPKGGSGRGTFTVRNRYLTTNGDRTVCTETCRYTILVRPAGYLLISDSTFTSDTNDFYFGDQEEMGFGVRLATPIAVKARRGARILDSEGRKDERGVWGKQSNWCDYSGIIEGHHVGVTIMPDPGNVRRCWWHARDYGFMAANPFGVNAFTRGPKSKVVIEHGKSLRLRYGVLLHGGSAVRAKELEAAYEDYLRLIAE